MKIPMAPLSDTAYQVNSSKEKEKHVGNIAKRRKQQHRTIKVKYKACIKACAYVYMLSSRDVLS